MRNAYFKKLLLVMVVFVLVTNILLLSAYSFFGKRTYLQLEVDNLQTLLESAQDFYAVREDAYIDIRAYMAVLDLMETTSDAQIYYLIGVYTNVETNAYMLTVLSSVLKGESFVDFDSEALGDVKSICLAAPLYNSNQQIDGAIILVKQTEYIDNAFDKLNSVLWIMAAFLLPPIILFAYAGAQRLSRPMRDMTNIAIQVTNGNYNVRANENLRGEMGIFARAMNRMSEEIEKTIFQLNSEKRQLSYILTSFSDGVAAIDEMGNLTHYNPALMQMFGTVEIKSPIDLIPDRTIWDAFATVIDTKEPHTLQYSLPGDKMLWISIVPVMSEDETCIGAVGLFKDMTEIERLERVRRDYVANVSHELRTPLTAVRGLLEPLADGMIKDDATKQRYYNIMLKEVERLSRLITDTLQLSRLQSGTEYMEVKSFDINDVLNDVVQNYRNAATEKGIDLSLVTHDMDMVISDEDRIEQVLIILLDNAMRYAGQGGKVEIAASEDIHDVYVSVCDNGCGIKSEDLPFIFERFYKVDKSRKEGGTGLGLSIAKQIIDKLGEQITVDSKVGEGTCFRFTIKKYVTNAIPLGPIAPTSMYESESVSAEPKPIDLSGDAEYEVLDEKESIPRKKRK